MSGVDFIVGGGWTFIWFILWVLLLIKMKKRAIIGMTIPLLCLIVGISQGSEQFMTIEIVWLFFTASFLTMLMNPYFLLGFIIGYKVHS